VKTLKQLKAVAFLFVLCVATAAAREKGDEVPNDSVSVQVFTPGHDATFPELLPFDGPITPPEGCKQNLDGKVGLSLLVDAAGRPRNVMFLRPLTNDLDRYALRIAGADRFKPGVHNGAPVSVAVSLEIDIKSCVAATVDSKADKNPSRWLRSLPEQRLGPPYESGRKIILLTIETPQPNSAVDVSHLEHLGGKVSAPVPMNQVEAEFSDEAKSAKYQGVSIISVVVDAHGMPQDARVVRAVGMGLDQKALEAVGRYRFKPAMKDGVPVPVMITVEVNFRL
jgi:TonB family protein